MSKRLSEVVVEVVVRKTEKNRTESVRESSTVVTKIIKLGYRAEPETKLKIQMQLSNATPWLVTTLLSVNLVTTTSPSIKVMTASLRRKLNPSGNLSSRKLNPSRNARKIFRKLLSTKFLRKECKTGLLLTTQLHLNLITTA
jgi:hypothetical protein